MKISTEKDKQRAIAEIKALDLSERSYKFTLKIYREIRSLRQNSLYWLWLTIIEYETGNDKNYLHEKVFGKKYLKQIEVKVTYPKEEIITKNQSTTELDTKEFKIYLNKIHLEMAENMPEIQLPDPKDKDFDRQIDYYSDII